MSKLRWLGLMVAPLVVIATGCMDQGFEQGRPDILLISVDTVRVDDISAHAGFPQTTPFLDQLAAEGVRFDRAYSTSSWTTPSVVSMLTSSYPSRHGVGQGEARNRDGVWETIPNNLTTLAEALKEGGYRTYGLTAQFGLAPERGFARGFDKYQQLGPVNSDSVSTALAGWIPELSQGKPWFLWIHLFDPHAPYERRGEGIEVFWPADRQSFSELDAMEAKSWMKKARQLDENQVAYVRALYRSEVRASDDFIREVFERLPRANDALVVFTADHGEEFLDNGGVGHGSTLREEVIRIPLLVRFANRFLAGAVVNEPVSLVDVLPTILKAVGLKPAADVTGVSLAGQNGLQVPTGRPVYSELLRGTSGLRAVIGSQYKFVSYPNSEKHRVLTDLVADPQEKTNLLQSQPELVVTLEAEIEDFTQRNLEQRSTVTKTKMSPEQLQKLRSLGYTQ